MSVTQILLSSLPGKIPFSANRPLWGNGFGAVKYGAILFLVAAAAYWAQKKADKTDESRFL